MNKITYFSFKVLMQRNFALFFIVLLKSTAPMLKNVVTVYSYLVSLVVL
jgi:hypothetical protein